MDGPLSFICKYKNFIDNIDKASVENKSSYVPKKICKVFNSHDRQVSSYPAEEDNRSIDNFPENVIDVWTFQNYAANTEETKSQESEITYSAVEKNKEDIKLKTNQGYTVSKEAENSSRNKMIYSAVYITMGNLISNNCKDMDQVHNKTDIKQAEGFSTDRNYNIISLLPTAFSTTEQSAPAESAQIDIRTSVNHDPTQDNIEKYRAYNNNINIQPINNPGIIITKILDNTTINENCYQCSLMKKCLYNINNQNLNIFICSETCFISLQKFYNTHLKSSKITKFISYIRKCVECSVEINQQADTFLSWEFMEFCNVNCLSRYQCKFYSCCSHCRLPISIKSLGTFCVRFGHSIQQFCNTRCLVQFKEEWNVCAYCQNNLTKYDKLLSAHNLKRELKNFCSQLCLEKQIQINNVVNNVPTSEIFECSFCNEEKDIKIYLNETNKISLTIFCSTTCFSSYKLKYLIFPVQCDLCKFYFDDENCSQFIIYYNNVVKNFCCQNCHTIFILANRRITSCCSCEVEKYDMEMIKKSYNNDLQVMACSLRCLSIFEISSNTVSTIETKCDCCLEVFPTQLQLTVSDGTIRNFCNYECLTKFQNKCKNDSNLFARVDLKTRLNENNHSLSENCNNSFEELQNPVNTKRDIISPVLKHQIKQSNRTKSKKPNTRVKQINVKIPSTPVNKNATALCNPILQSNDGFCDNLDNCAKEAQTDQTNLYPLPIALQIAVPVVVPLTQNFTIKQNPELLILAKEIAGQENNITIEEHHNSNDTNIQNVRTQCVNAPCDEFSTGLDVFREQNESSTSRTNTQNQDNVTEMKMNNSITGLKRKRRQLKKSNRPVKRRLCMSPEIDISSLSPDQFRKSANLAENFESNQSLKYRLALYVWKQWIQTKNNALKNVNAVELFKYDILQLTKEELNHYLCMFIQEIEKPDGTKYAPDTIYYLCLAIQFYLMKNNREDNIFTDTSYEKFIDCMYEISKIYYIMFNHTESIITRVEEEHLWDTKQLGPHSPQALLNTLIYFNTKYFYLSTVEEHMNISFSRIIKYWKDTSYEQERANDCNTINSCLRYFPLMVTPISLNKHCVQRENIENPQRCPIMLYEFYLSKLPRNVKLSNKSFYFMPEQNCLAENNLWYSTTPMNRETLDKILHRVKMVKEVNLAFMH